MTIYELTADRIRSLAETTFGDAGIQERADLQRLLKDQIDIISPDTLVIAEEFGEWADSRRRIDLLGIDKEANVVVIELKKTEDGGHMELQAIRYAAMVSTMTFDNVVATLGRYLQSQGRDDDPKAVVLDFLEWDEPDEERFAQDVRIVLASADFSKELTTAVMWLNERGVDIRCIRLKPYADGIRLLLDVQQIIPLPEAEEYQVRIKEKQQQEREARKSSRDLAKFDVSIRGTMHQQLNKRRAIFTVVRYLCESGVAPMDITAEVPWRQKRMFCKVDGTVDSDEFSRIVQSGRKRVDLRRYFSDEDELIHFDGNTYAFTNQWGTRTLEAMSRLIKAFPDRSITCKKSE